MLRVMWIGAALLIGLSLPVCVRAANPPGPPPTQGAPVGNSDGAGGTVAGQPAPNIVVASCETPSQAASAAHPPVSVTINPATRWQPRGGEVIVAIKGAPELFRSFTVRACFGWSDAKPGKYFTPENLAAFQDAFVHLRPSDLAGVVNIGVIVPNLEWTASDLFSRWSMPDRSAGLGTVPVVGMRLIGYTDTGVLFDVIEPVGVTSVSFSILLVVIIMTISMTVIYRTVGGPPLVTPIASRRRTLVAWLQGMLKFRWVLSIVETADGRASLSAFQILLWTSVVAASAVYVMALSGNLINITPGTLTLLGIAGAASLIAAAQDSSATDKKLTTPGSADPVVTTDDKVRVKTTVPRWAHLIQGDSGDPEVTRIQMLGFTLVSAGFVLIQVINTYVIPDIPVGYQILMGISNGIYVGRKFTGKT